MRIEIDREDIAAAAAAGLVDTARVDTLFSFLADRVGQDGSVRVSPSRGTAERDGRAGPVGRFGIVHVLWFAGSLLVLGAMTFFATVGFDAFGGVGLSIIAAVYGALFGLVGARLWRNPSLKVFGGLCVTLAVGMVPLFTYGLERATGWWPSSDPGTYRGFTDWVKGGWLMMEVTTVIAGVLALRRVRFPFLVVVPSVALWFMSMDLSEVIFADPDVHVRGGVSIAFGIAMLAVSGALRWRKTGDLAFWLDTFGLVALQGGLLSQQSDQVMGKLVFVAVQLAILEGGRRLERGFFVVVGTVGLTVLAGKLLSGSHALALVLAFVPAMMLFAYGYAARRLGPSPSSAVAFLGCVVFALVLPWEQLDGEMGDRAVYALVAALLVLLAVPARSRVLVAGGGLGIAVLLGDLAFSVFRDSMVFPLVVASLGIGIMVLGLAIHKSRDRLDAMIDGALPGVIKVLRVPRG